MRLLILTLIFLFCSNNFFQEKAWELFSSDEDGFEVLMPARPMLKEQTVDTDAGKINYNLYYALLNGEVFAIASYNFPAEKLSGTVEQRLDNARDQAIASSKGKLISEKKISIDEYPGRELKNEIANGQMIRSRIYAVKNRLITILVVAAKDEIDQPPVDKFLNSLRLKKEVEGNKSS